jgi:hypothetical protein
VVSTEQDNFESEAGVAVTGTEEVIKKTTYKGRSYFKKLKKLSQ